MDSESFQLLHSLSIFISNFIAVFHQGPFIATAQGRSQQTTKKSTTQNYPKVQKIVSKDN